VGMGPGATDSRCAATPVGRIQVVGGEGQPVEVEMWLAHSGSICPVTHDDATVGSENVSSEPRLTASARAAVLVSLASSSNVLDVATHLAGVALGPRSTGQFGVEREVAELAQHV